MPGVNGVKVIKTHEYYVTNLSPSDMPLALGQVNTCFKTFKPS